METTQEVLDALPWSSARVQVLTQPVRVPWASYPPAVIEVHGPRLVQLRESLRLEEDDRTVACYCPGTLLVKLLQGTRVAASLLAHIHARNQSLVLVGSGKGRDLVDGRAVLELLADWGWPGLLQGYQDEVCNTRALGPDPIKLERLLRRRGESR
jgi:hypothetical protein